LALERYELCPPTGNGAGIEADVIADLCARDWGLWRTIKATIERCQANLATSGIDPQDSGVISARLALLWERIEAAPKTARWRLRSRVGDRVRWYDEPEENPAGTDGSSKPP
jgi:hypothetical protein